jgi:hypothetical protein
VPVACW